MEMRNFVFEFTDLEHTRLELPNIPVSLVNPESKEFHPRDGHGAPKSMSNKIAYGFVKTLLQIFT